MKITINKNHKSDLVESINEASKPTIKVVNKLKNEQGIQIVVVKTTAGETEYGGFVVRGKLQKVIPVGANKSKEDVKKRALQIWDEFGCHHFYYHVPRNQGVALWKLIDTVEQETENTVYGGYKCIKGDEIRFTIRS